MKNFTISILLLILPVLFLYIRNQDFIIDELAYQVIQSDSTAFYQERMNIEIGYITDECRKCSTNTYNLYIDKVFREL